MSQAAGPVKISFGLKRKEDTKVQATAVKEVIDVEVDSDEEREQIEAERQAKRRKLTHFDGTIEEDEYDKKKKEKIVIPMVIENDWRTQKLLEKEKEGTLTEEERAKLLLLTEGCSKEEDENASAAEMAIKTKETVDEAPDADYNAVPIEHFGLAILRGCNWKDGDGIGKNPQKVPLRLPARRPNGLGLGAKPRNAKDSGKAGQTNGNEVVEEDIKTGTCIKIVDGRNKGRYGKVEARDDDANSLFVKLAIGNKSIKVSLFAVQAVGKKEYERDSRCMNKNDYDRERAKIEERNEKVKEKDGKKEKDRKYKDEKKEESIWARPDLLVRFIDEEYARGSLYGQKVHIIDVAGHKNITLEDEKGNHYFNMRQSWIETVVPRNAGEQVMVVTGRRKGLAGIMADKDKRKYKATVRIFSTEEEVRLNFEDICAFRTSQDMDYD